MSFMPKGSSLSKNIRRVNEVQSQGANQLLEIRNQVLPHEEQNGSSNSDDGSKYSYEETDEDPEKSYNDTIQSDVGSHFSPIHSADDSPELGSKSYPRFETSMKTELQSINEQPISLHLRKAGQPSFLKPLLNVSKPKVSSKSSKKFKKRSSTNSRHEGSEDEKDFEAYISAFKEEQKLVLERIKKEWATMQEELEWKEKSKYEQIVFQSSKKFEEEESFLRRENSEKLSQLKDELTKRLQEEEETGQASLAEIKKANELKCSEEEQNLKKKLYSLTEHLKREVDHMEHMNLEVIAEKKKELDNELKKDIEEYKIYQNDNRKKTEQECQAEIALIQDDHKKKIAQLQDFYTKKEQKSVVKDPATAVQIDEQNTELHFEIQKKEDDFNGDKKYQNLLTDLEHLKAEISRENDVLLKLEDKTATAQTYYEGIQDEVDKAENDLDLLRNEKTALISELTILKNEKSNLLNRGRKVESLLKGADLVNKGINTNKPYVTSEAIQACMEQRDISCQVKEIESSKRETYCQTISERGMETVDVSCQAELVPLLAHTDTTAQNNPVINIANKIDSECAGMDGIISRMLENALVEVNNKIEVRMKSIEKQVGSLQENISLYDSQDVAANVSNHLNRHVQTEVKYPPNNWEQDEYHKNFKSITVTATNRVSSEKNCNCEHGDSGSCKVMQDVKNSVYHLNDILNESFASSLSDHVVNGFNYPVTQYSSPLKSFYTQFRQLQEKHHFTEMKHKWYDGVVKPQNILPHTVGTDYLKDFVGKDPLTLNKVLNYGPYSINAPYDTIGRAQNLVLKEQARSWKQQQQLLTTLDSQTILSTERIYNVPTHYNVSRSASSRYSDKSVPFQCPFLKFEPDPESEYNEWMSRLKAIEDRIRNHRLL